MFDFCSPHPNLLLLFKNTHPKPAPRTAPSTMHPDPRASAGWAQREEAR